MEAAGLAVGVGAEGEHVGALFGIPGHQQLFFIGFFINSRRVILLAVADFILNRNPNRQTGGQQRHVLLFFHRQTDPLDLAGGFDIEIRFLVQLHFLIRLYSRNQRSQIDFFGLLFGFFLPLLGRIFIVLVAGSRLGFFPGLLILRLGFFLL